MYATAAKKPLPDMEYTVKCISNRAGIEAWLPAEVEMVFNWTGQPGEKSIYVYAESRHLSYGQVKRNVVDGWNISGRVLDR